MKQFIDILIQTYLIMLPIFCGYIIWLLQRGKKKQDIKEAAEQERIQIENKRLMADMHGTMLIIRYMLGRYHTEYVYRGYITADQLSNFDELYEAYKDLGGNSVAHKWYEEVESLPIKSGNDISIYAEHYTNSIKQHL